jgi:septal ring factor EnvC (AmiA/AmiB activator)
MEVKLKEREEILTKLRASAGELEAILSRFTGGSGSSDSKAPQLRVASLPLPVSGEIVQKFGRQKHEQFSDMLFIKGIEFAVAIGDKVRTVREGQVVLSQVLPGYGHLVIIDHGGRCYSLYGRLASSLVGVGAKVKQHDVIGVVGQADERGRNFYFELRLKGKPVDPSPYFQTSAVG